MLWKMYVFSVVLNMLCMILLVAIGIVRNVKNIIQNYKIIYQHWNQKIYDFLMLVVGVL